jgi:hypothetical protein
MSTLDPAEASIGIMTSDGAERVCLAYKRRKEAARSARAHRLNCRRLATGMKKMHECIAKMHVGLSKQNEWRPRTQVVTKTNYQQMPTTPRAPSTEARPRSPVGKFTE